MFLSLHHRGAGLPRIKHLPSRQELRSSALLIAGIIGVVSFWQSGVAAQTASTSSEITVNTLNDYYDISGNQQVSDLPGPDGRVSFREAVAAANNTPGPQTIAFAIPTAEFWLLSDVALLKLEQNAFFLNDSATTIDFSTQTTNIGDTNPNGPEVGIYGLEPNGWGIAAIFVNGDNCVVKGLGPVYQRGYAVRVVGDNNRVIGSRVTGPLNSAISIEGYSGGPVPVGNVIGGTAAGDGNYLSGLRLGGPAENNVVIGNTIIGGVDVIGSAPYGIRARGNRIGGPTPAERNVISGAGYYGEEGFPVGEQISVVDADDTWIEGNYIGTTTDGMARYPQQIGPIGVEVRDSRATTIRGNLIAGLRTVGTDHYSGQIFGWAVLVRGTNSNISDTVVDNNTIGLAADGVSPIVTRSGITVSPLSFNYRAIATRIASNHIARVETTAVAVGSSENGVTITANSIYDSGALGIDLFAGNFGGVGGVTPNDAGDGDIGGNGLQNFPVIQSASTTGSEVRIEGTLDSVPSEEFTIELFSSPSCDASGFGEGALFLGSSLVATDNAGRATLSISLPAAVPVGASATATATRLSTGDTSEFSGCVAITADATPQAPARTPFDYDGDGRSDVGVFRPSTGTWYVLRSQSQTYERLQYGQNNDVPVDANFDGDMKTDYAVWRPSTGEWWFISSSTGTPGGARWGLTGDKPVPADYDADGLTDLAVWRPSNGMTYIVKSTGGFQGAQWGTNGDMPAHADVNYDGKADFVVFRPSTGTWFTLISGTSTNEQYQFGQNGDIPVRGDFDGDQNADIAVWRPSDGTWWFRRSSNGSIGGFQWGTNGDRPVPGDYDGDGRTDYGVWRPSNGIHYIVYDTGGFLGAQWGTSGDIPILAAPLP
jgi:hypothetical protein